MTVDEALELADEWTKGATFHADSQGWKAVCAVLAEEVRRGRKAYTGLGSLSWEVEMPRVKNDAGK